MCLTNETVDELHAVTSAMKAAQSDCTAWLGEYDALAKDAKPESQVLLPMYPTRAEAEQIFAQRIAAHESRLAELGWSRKVRVTGETQPQGETK